MILHLRIIAYDNNLAASAVVLGKNGGNFVEVEGANTVNGLEGGITIRRAALPSFRVLNKTALVWVLTDGLSLSVTNKEAGIEISKLDGNSNAIYGTGSSRTAKITPVSLANLEQVPTLTKIYKKSDSDKKDVKATFKVATTKVTDPLKTSGGSTLTIETEATTKAGTYVAEVEYEVAKDKKETASIEFVVDPKATSTNLPLKFKTGTAPVATAALNTVIQGAANEVQVDADTTLVLIDTNPITATCEDNGTTFASGKTSTITVKVKAADNHKPLTKATDITAATLEGWTFDASKNTFAEGVIILTFTKAF